MVGNIAKKWEDHLFDSFFPIFTFCFDGFRSRCDSALGALLGGLQDHCGGGGDQG